MRINFEGKTNHDYVMINTLKIQLQSGSVLTLDRKFTDYLSLINDTTFDSFNPEESASSGDFKFTPSRGDFTLQMDWQDCYLWAIDGENLFAEEVLITENTGKLFEGAKLYELELEDDSDEDYFVNIQKLSIDGTSILV